MAQNLGMKPPSQRQLRVGEVIRQALAEAFLRGEVYIAGLGLASVTVAEVRMSPDMKNATAFVSLLGTNAPDVQVICHALNESADELRRAVAKRIYMKFTPKLRFKADESFDVAGRVHAILRSPKVMRDLENAEEEQE